MAFSARFFLESSVEKNAKSLNEHHLHVIFEMIKVQQAQKQAV